MTTKGKKGKTLFLLGVECGGTRTSAMMMRTDTGERQTWEGGPSNLRLRTDDQLLAVFRNLRKAFPAPDSLAIGMAGVRTAADTERIQKLANEVWPGVPCATSHDLEPALAAAPRIPAKRGGFLPQILVLSGTGSCCLGVAAGGKRVKIGGWGHILGDKGSAHEIGIRALKALAYYLDRDGEWSLLGRRVLRRLLLNEPNDLIAWVHAASKDQVAALAMEVFEAARDRDRIARDILEGAAASLAADAISTARRIARSGEAVQFVFAGSVLLRQPAFAAKVKRKICQGWKRAVVTPLKEPSVAGAVELARRLIEAQSQDTPARVSQRPETWHGAEVRDLPSLVPEATQMSPTERRNPRSLRLDRMSLDRSIELFLAEDARMLTALHGVRSEIRRTLEMIVTAFRCGGRLFYVGAGTSGRLGVLDASECPPTFRTPPDQVQGIIAGGLSALHQSIEGAEDEPDMGAQSIVFRGVGAKDVVVGIAASGRTPFVWGALAEARHRGARTVLLCCNPHLKFRQGQRPDVVLAVDVGPEILTGSTRLKSGTATKLILNMLTTLSLVKMGKVVSNLMIDVSASNTKLEGRAIRILQELTGAGEEAARTALVRSAWDVKRAWQSFPQRT